MSNDDDKVPQNKKIEPCAPMFTSIFAPKARMLYKKVVTVNPLEGLDNPGWCNAWKETKMGPGPIDDNLEQRSINKGMVGLVVGIVKERPTMCRVLVTVNNPEKDGIYIIDASRLVSIDTIEQAEETAGNKVEEF